MLRLAGPQGPNVPVWHRVTTCLPVPLREHFADPRPGDYLGGPVIGMPADLSHERPGALPVRDHFRANRALSANMLAAGEDPQVVADEHGVGIEAVRTAARVLLGHAA
jgi:hypothetical protein